MCTAPTSPVASIFHPSLGFFLIRSTAPSLWIVECNVSSLVAIWETVRFSSHGCISRSIWFYRTLLFVRVRETVVHVLCSGTERLIPVQENIDTCAYTSYEVSQDFYVGHWRQLKRITVLGRPNYIRYKKIAQLYQQSLQKSTSPIIDSCINGNPTLNLIILVFFFSSPVVRMRLGHRREKKWTDKLWR